ncbi:ATP-binding protein [candidate division KSB1 bacterium]|nr:ATP-binding protein [candidate division KSB1 bacterium]
MNTKYNQPLVTTIRDRCRVCYTCVRECPAKAIRIANGQAEVIPARCIGCGNCIKLCSQKAKKAVSAIPEVEDLLASGAQVVACIAPSFPAEFPEMHYRQFVGMVRSLGFTYVNEVGFGADLVARKMQELLQSSRSVSFISTACPAVFGYVKRYHPELIHCLAPVVSPMIAMARVLRALHGPGIKIVFIGPCIAKKMEAYSDEVQFEIDEVLTFEELSQMFRNKHIHSESVEPSEFDLPHASKGSLFPIGRGLLEAANIHEDLAAGEVISASGRANFIDAIMEFSSGEANARFLDVLCCDGCIMGPGLTTKAPVFKRRALISQYARESLSANPPEEWASYMELFKTINLARRFSPFDQRMTNPDEKTIQQILASMGKFKSEDELNCGACGYETCRHHAIAIHKGLAEAEMCLPFIIERLHETVNELAISNDQLASTREALIQSEKMASMGQLSAGIAHEINNPLGVVLMYSHLLLDEIEQKNDLRDDVQMIAEHADRAKKIVAGLLNFARQNKVNLKPVEVPKLIDDTLKAIQIPKNIAVEIKHDLKNRVAELDRDQIIQVITNFCNNSLTAMPNGGVLTIGTSDDENNIKIKVCDTGSGIPKEILNKIFEPFFTTKPAGKGTGLGLAITYGIIKMHRGDVQVVSNPDPAVGPTGTTITVTLPRQGVK